MRTQVRAGRGAGIGVAIRFTVAQRDAIRSVAELMRSLPISSGEFEAQVGVSRDAVSEIESRLSNSDGGTEIEFSMAEIHVIHALLMVAQNQFRSEEDFYVRVGFFRDNITGLAMGIVRAIGQLST